MTIGFASDPALPPPSAAVVLWSPDGRPVSSAAAWSDGVLLERDAGGRGAVTVIFPALPLLKGTYTVAAYLLCERGLLTYEMANPVATLEVSQSGIEQGTVFLQHHWAVE